MEDIAFEATGKSPEELFTASCDAVTNVMIDNLEDLEPQIERGIEISESSLEMLLYQFLNEIVYYKDSEELLLRCREMTIVFQDKNYRLNAVVYGSMIDRSRHRLKTDIKAVTLYNLKVIQNPGWWHCVVVVDV